MKYLAINTLLVLALAFILSVPMLGFGFMGIDESPNSSEVLGTRIIRVDADENSKNVKVVEQIDLSLNLSDNKIQKFYNVVPERFVDGDYSFVAIVSPELRDFGLYPDLIKEELSYDLVLFVEDESLYDSVVTATILVLK